MKTFSTLILFFALSTTLLAQDFDIDFNLTPIINPNPIYWIDEDWELEFSIENLTNQSLMADLRIELLYKGDSIIVVNSNEPLILQPFDPEFINADIFNYYSDDYSVGYADLPPDEVIDNFKATGLLLAENYEICFIITPDTGVIYKECFPLKIMQYERPKLLYPANNTEFKAGGSSVLFEWENDFQYFPEQKYTITFYELFEGQNSDQAVKTNTALWFEDEIPNPSVYINLDDLPLVPGQQYLWQVMAIDDATDLPVGFPDGLSEPLSFSISVLPDEASNDGSLWHFAFVDANGDVLPCDQKGGSGGSQRDPVKTGSKATSRILDEKKANSQHTLIENGEILRIINPANCLQQDEGKFSFTLKYALTIPCVDLEENSRKKNVPYRVVSRLFKNGMPLGHKSTLVHGMETRDGLDEDFDKDGIINTSDFDFMCIEVGPGEYEQRCAVLINLEIELRDTTSIAMTDSFHLATFIPEVGHHDDINLSLSNLIALSKSSNHVAQHIQLTQLPIQDSKYCKSPPTLPEQKKALRTEKTDLTSHSLDLIAESIDLNTSGSDCSFVPYRDSVGNRAVILTYDLVIEDSTIHTLDSFTMVSYFSNKRKSPNSLAEYREMAKQDKHPIQIIQLPIANSHFCQTANKSAFCYETKKGKIKIPISCFVFLTDEQFSKGEIPKLITHIFKNEKLTGKKVQVVDITKASEGSTITVPSTKDGFLYCETQDNTSWPLPLKVQFTFPKSRKY